MSGQSALAVRQAAPQSRAAPITLQRSCACEQSGESCARCAGTGKPLQRLATGGGTPAGLPSSVGDVLGASGRPLPIPDRTRMEHSFGHDFSSVRIHDDSAAHASAAAVHARAYTVGHHVVLGRNAPDLSSTAGRQLLGHELTHVVQQSRGSGVADGIDPDPALEREADQVGSAVAAGHSTALQGSSPLALHREAEEESFPNVEKVAIYIGQQLGLGEGTSRVVAAGFEGGTSGFMHRWNTTTRALLGKEMKKFSFFTDLIQLYKGYLVGLFEGVVSPITDLFSIGAMLEELNSFLNKIAMSALTKAGELAQDLRGIIDSIRQTYGELKAEIKQKLKEAPKEVFKALLTIFGSNGGLVERAVGLARTVGRTQGENIAKGMEAPFAAQKAEPEEAPKGAIGWVQAKLGKGRDALIESPWSKVGNKAGYAVGFALIQVLMLVFSEGIGNLIGMLAKALSGVAKAGTLLGRVIEGIAKFLATAGKMITTVEEAVNAVMSFLMKPLMPILDPILKPFANVMERLGKFFRKLFGIAEKDAAQIAKSAAAKTLGEAHAPAPPAAAAHVPSGASPPVHGGGSHASPPPGPTKHPAPPPAERPKAKAARADATPEQSPPTSKPEARKASDAAPHEPQPATSSATEPHAPAKQPDEPSTASKGSTEPHPKSEVPTEARIEPEQATARQPTVNGHEAVVTPQGVGICSPAPCPVMHLEYKAELDQFPKLAKWNDKIQALRNTDPKKAAEEAAALVRSCEAARNNAKRAGQMAPSAAAAETGPVKDRLGKPMPEGHADDALKKIEQPDPWSLDASEKRAAQIKSGEKDFVLDQPVTRGDIDEPLAVGAPGIKPQRAVDRAMDPHNRQFLDPATNRRTKHVGTSSRDVARGREKLEPVSLKDEPDALFNRRFDETHEMNKIFDEAKNRVHNKGKLSPTQLKDRINREVSNIIKEGNSAEAKTVREVLTSKGFVFKERVGWVATKELP